MAQNASELRVAPRGDLRVAPLGSPVIELAGASYDAAYDILGLLDDSGVELTANKETGSIGVWQQAAPGLYYLESAGFSAAYTLAQYNERTLTHYFGAEFAIDAPGGTGRLEVSSNPDLDEMMLAIEWQSQGGYKNHIIIERGMVTERNSITINRTTGTMSGVTFTAMDHEGRLAVLLTNDPAVVGVVSS